MVFKSVEYTSMSIYMCKYKYGIMENIYWRKRDKIITMFDE